MEIKGIAVKSIADFVKNKYAARYHDWLGTLPPDSKKIMMESIYANTWYPIKAAGIIPTQKLGELFFGSAVKGAWENGRYSAEQSLTGIYKIYVKFSSPTHIIERAGRIMQAYYNPSEMVVVEKKSNSVKIAITKFGEPSEIIENRIGGWCQRALEISGCKTVNVEIVKSLAKGDKSTELQLSWS